MKTLDEMFFDDPALDQYTLADLEQVEQSHMGESTPEDWAYVVAKTTTRGSPMASTNVCRVLSSTTGDPLVDQTQQMSLDEIVDAMPRSPRQRKAVPSKRGEYLTVKEVRGAEQPDGTVEPQTRGRTTVIPVEFVIDPLSYDETVVRLIDNSL